MNWQCHPWNVKLDHQGHEIWLMEEIRVTTWDVVETLEIMDNGINYQPQLVQDFGTINCITLAPKNPSFPLSKPTPTRNSPGLVNSDEASVFLK